MAEIGRLPKSWKVERLGSLAGLIQYGTSERATENGTGVPVLGIPHVVRGEVEPVNLRYLPESARGLSKLILANGDLLFVRTNATRANIGHCAVYEGHPKTAAFASYLIRVRLESDVALPEFVHLYTWSDIGQSFLSGHATGAADGKFNINSQILRDVPIPLPPRSEQQEIVRIVSSVERKLKAELQRRDALKDIIGSLLADLMTGKRRVPAAEGLNA